jgi:hypothetical protein
MGVDAAPAADSHLVYLLTDSLDGAQPPVARSELFARDPAGRKDGERVFTLFADALISFQRLDARLSSLTDRCKHQQALTCNAVLLRTV